MLVWPLPGSVGVVIWYVGSRIRRVEHQCAQLRARMWMRTSFNLQVEESRDSS